MIKVVIQKKRSKSLLLMTRESYLDAILNYTSGLRSGTAIAKGFLGKCPLSAFLFEGEIAFNVL